MPLSARDQVWAMLQQQFAWCRLERLELGFCGRGFVDSVAQALARAEGGLAGLEALHLGGAYCLLDSGLEALLGAAPNLQELHLPHASRIAGPSLACLPTCNPLLRHASSSLSLDCITVVAGHAPAEVAHCRMQRKK